MGQQEVLVHLLAPQLPGELQGLAHVVEVQGEQRHVPFPVLGAVG